MLPLLAVTVGDPAGIGPEIVLKAMRQRRPELARLVAVGSLLALRRAASVVPDAPRLREFPAGASPANAGGDTSVLEVVAVEADQDVPVGRLSPQAGAIAYATVQRAVELALQGEVDGIVTAPLNKEAIALAGHPYPGHTEILARLTGTEDFAMMLTARDLRVVHVTTHIALREVLERVTPERVLTTIRLAAQALAELGDTRPIGVAGLNPHAGEGGLFGDEEERIIAPALAQARAQGIEVTGPWPADTLFGRAAGGEFGVVVAMYHDQGHIAVKMLGFDTGVNATIGLPILRTSVDHGTAFDIAGTGTASPDSLLAAIATAATMARARAGTRGR